MDYYVDYYLGMGVLCGYKMREDAVLRKKFCNFASEQ